MPESALRYIAALGASRGGDARYAIDLFRESIKLMIVRELNELTEDLVREVVPIVEKDYLREALVALAKPHKLLLYILAKEGELSPTELYKRFNKIATSFGMYPLSERRLRELVYDLELMGFINIIRAAKRWRISLSETLKERVNELIKKIRTELL